MKPDGHLELIGELHPGETMQAELTNKTVGRVTASGGGRHHKYEPHMEQSRQDEFTFAHDVADWLAWITHLQAQGHTTSLVMGSVNLLLGSFIVAFHRVWQGIALIVTVFGVLFLFRSVALLFFPGFLPKMLKKLAPRSGGLVRVSGLIIVIVAAALFYDLYM